MMSENKLEASLLQATGNIQQQKGEEVFDSKLNKVIQPTAGFSDPVYAEACVLVNQYDIGLDVLVVNQMSDTLQGLTLELATLGDLRLVEKLTPTVLGPHGFENIKATIKISSTENGIIFGNIGHIYPATCTDEEFRKMWVEFEWENKITVTASITDLDEYLAHLVKSTNMKCLTPEKGMALSLGDKINVSLKS